MRLLIVLLLLWTVTPTVPEATESIVHWAAHGDAAHSADGSHEPSGDEHGCTPLFHMCGCHASAPTSISRRLVPGPGRSRVVVLELPSVRASAGRVVGPPPLRPPIA